MMLTYRYLLDTSTGDKTPFIDYKNEYSFYPLPSNDISDSKCSCRSDVKLWKPILEDPCRREVLASNRPLRLMDDRPKDNNL